MNHSEAVGELVAASQDYVSRVDAIADNFKPRGGQRWPQEVIDTLSSESIVRPYQMLQLAMSLRMDGAQRPNCLDFGCGNGRTKPIIEQVGLTYTGIDYSDSLDPLRTSSIGTDFENEVVHYNGLDMPFPDNSFSVVFAWSALEHVVFPEKSFAEIGRVLRPGGVLVGSIPHLMPYHAESTINYTAYGFHQICQRNGMQVLKVIPHLDALSFLTKSIALTLGIADSPEAIDAPLRTSPIITKTINQLRKRGYPEWMALAFHAEVCAEFGAIARKPLFKVIRGAK